MISKIKLQRFLLIAGVTRYLEFKSIEGSYVMGKSGKISKVGFTILDDADAVTLQSQNCACIENVTGAC